MKYAACLFGAMWLGAVGCGGGDSDGSGASGDTFYGGSPSGAGGGAAGATTGSGGDEVPATEESVRRAPDPAPLADSVLSSLKGDIDAALDGVPGATETVLIVGAETGQTVYSRTPDKLLAPASNTKLFTTSAAMLALGEENRTRSTVYATDDASDGVVTGDLVLLGEHDYSLSTYYYGSSHFPLDVLAGELAASGLTKVTGGVKAQGEFVYEGDELGTYDPASDRTAAANAFRAALVASGITIGGGATTSTSFDPPAGATELAHWETPPLALGEFTINVHSHNEFADELNRHLGYEASGTSSYAAGFAAILDALADLQIDTTGLDLNDGSGLSHDNRVSATQIVSLLKGMLARPEGLAWTRTFAVGGVSGTLASRLTGADTRGYFIGKTGTLTGVVALSGVLRHRYDGQRYLVSMIMNNVPDSTTGRAALDKVVTALSHDLRKLGKRPAPPTLGCVTNDGNGGTVSVTWSEVPDASGYLVWRSADGKVWDRSEARLVTKTSHRTIPVGDAKELFVRVTAVGAAGESEPSDVYAARIGDAASRVLLVDGNDRWEAEPAPDNYLGRGHDLLVPAAEAIDGLAYDSCANEIIGAGDVALKDYGAAVWTLGNESTEDESFDDAEQGLVKAFVDGGGTLFVSGAELAWDLGNKGSATDQAFLQDVLGATYKADDAGTITARGAAALDGVGLFCIADPAMIEVDYPDQLAAAGGSTVVVQYVGGSGGAAGLLIDRGGSRVVTLGFPLETVDAIERRRALLALALDALRP